MNKDSFHHAIQSAAALPPAERHAALTAIHTDMLKNYLAALQTITPEKASTPVSDADPRSMTLLVGHIADWEAYAIQTAGLALSGVTRLPIVDGLYGFADEKGETLDFDSVDHFNDHSVKFQSDWSWEKMHAYAVETATALHTLFTHPDLLTAEKLERTDQTYRCNEAGEQVPGLRMGWLLWIIFIDHPVMEHGETLGIL